MLKRTINAIQDHARAEYPRECCGVIIKFGRSEKYIPCRNMSDDKDNFKLSSEDYANAEDQGEIIAIVHSHPDYPPIPSEADKLACEESGLPWHIISLNASEFGEIRTYNPCGYVSPLIGRQFLHGVTDCYALVKDFYLRELGINLMDFDRTDDWWNKGQNLYLDNYKKAGFRRLEEGEQPKFGDMVLMQIKSPVINHAGVYLGNDYVLKEYPTIHKVPDAMLHHLYGRLSERVVYGGYWREKTILICRHKENE